MQLLNVISWFLIVLTILYILWVIFCAVYGLLMKLKPFPESDEKLRLAVVICARNEEKVIGNLIESLHQQDYPKDRYGIFVVAHNCRDQTAEIARNHGAEVFVRNCRQETHKGDALHFGLEQIQKNAAKPYDAFVVFDADNLAGITFLEEINKALCSGADVVQGFRATKNFKENLLTRLFGSMWMAMIYAQNLPHTALGLPVIISGTGFAAKFSVLDADGWQTKTLCEDIEFSVQQVLKGHKVISAAKAVFYDEQPGKLKIAVQQRFRWAVGIQQCFTNYYRPVLQAIPKRGISAVKIFLDIAMNPVLIVGSIGILLQVIFRLNQGSSTLSVLIFLVMLGAVGWLMVLPITINLLIRNKMPFFENLGVVILLPFFLFFSGLLAWLAPFSKGTTWKSIPHSSDKKLEDLEK